jgi:hypothetical protein
MTNPRNRSLLTSPTCVSTGFIISLICLAHTVSGCANDEMVATNEGAPEVAANQGAARDNISEAETGEREPDTSATVERELVLLHDTSQPTQLTITELYPIRAKVIDYHLAGPAVDVLVSYSIIANDNDGDASLASSQATTDENGEVAVTFRANFKANVNYTVELTANGAEAAHFNIFVTEAPSGDIRVQVAYEGPIAVENVHIRLLPGTFSCGQFNPTNVPDTPLAETTLINLAQDDDIVWSTLPESQKFTIVATGIGPQGSLTTAGCLDGVIVVAGEENSVTLTLFLLTLNPAGTYDTISTFDFTDAIPGEVGMVVDQIVILFTDPGQFIIDTLKLIVANYVGTIATDATFGLFETELAAIVTDWLLYDTPEWVQDIFIIGQDLIQVVHHLELLSTLQVSKLHNDYYVQGVLYWQGIALYWHYGCDLEGEPDYDPECGRFEFSLEMLSDGQFPLTLVEGQFTGSIIDFDVLDIDNHTIQLNYGQLIVYVINELLLPAITGYDSLEAAMNALVDCHSIATLFSNGVLDAIGVTESVIEEFCQDTLDVLMIPVQSLIGNLSLDSQLRLSGSGMMVDSDSDLYVDLISEADFIGHIELDGQQGPAFTASWEAIRQPDP